MSKDSKRLGSLDAIDLVHILRTQRAASFTLSELSQLTGRARSTVALRLDELLEAGLVAPLPDARPTGGRPSSRIAFNPATWRTIAIDIGFAHHIVALLDLAGEIIAEATFEAKVADGPASVLDAAVAAARSLLRGSSPAEDRIAAIGIGLPLPVFHDEGRAINGS